ncbi:MAG: hypothetical protein IPG12_03200 [Saprospiraceae bacterium]|nr:hypothetical protein [Saprospiraceae bacterium]
MESIKTLGISGLKLGDITEADVISNKDSSFVVKQFPEFSKFNEYAIGLVDITINKSITNDISFNDHVNDKKENKFKNAMDVDWQIFWNKFASAAYSRDKKRMVEFLPEFVNNGDFISKKDLLDQFFDNDNNFNGLINKLKNGVHDYYDNWDGTVNKMTGKQEPGDLVFKYENGQWKFIGIVGD